MLWMLIAAAIGFLIGYKSHKNTPILPLEPKVDTLVVRDTITLSKPIYLTRIKLDSVLVPVEVRETDTIYVAMQKEQVRWEDSLSVVYASGIMPQVDSVTHFTERMTITKEIPVIVADHKRWGIGIQAGYGVSAQGLSPYVGVGVTYNLFRF